MDEREKEYEEYRKRMETMSHEEKQNMARCLGISDERENFLIEKKMKEYARYSVVEAEYLSDTIMKIYMDEELSDVEKLLVMYFLREIVPGG